MPHCIRILSDVLLVTVVLYLSPIIIAQDVVGCGGFVQSDVDINYSLIEMKLYTKQGIVKYKTDCAPNNGYFLIPLYDKGTFILKIEPPSGWNFERHSVELQIDGKTDKCSKGEDINFVFTGFTLTGQVLSKGRPAGPAGVDVSLSIESVERKAVTIERGLFSFVHVMPGNYKLAASHATWTFQTAETQVSVTNGNIEVMDKLMVSGYDVKGHVLSEGEPIQAVGFLLFSKSISQQDVSGCETIPDQALQATKQKTEGESPLCWVKSGVDGVFVFPTAPSGDYTLIPFYQGEFITFDVVPTKLKFSVNYKSVVLKTPFQVHGFSVTGLVVTAEGTGIPGVSISIGEGQNTVTSDRGIYVLDNITAGVYAVQASKPGYFFDSMEVQVTPNTPKLPNIKPSGFHLCGKLEIQQLPPGVTQMSGRKVILQTEDAPVATRSMSASVDKTGQFCFRVAPGVHHIQPVVSGTESASGLLLTPAEQVVTVKSTPVFGITFSQFRATVSGAIKCIGVSCQGVSVSLSAPSRQDQGKVVVKVKEVDGSATFKFTNVLPGNYKAVILQETWCWQNKSLEVIVTDADVTDLTFVQSGFILKCTLSHNISLNFSLDSTGKDVVGSFYLNRGINKFCLSEPGIYNLTPKSCHRFEQEVYKYDTSSPFVLALTAVKHWLSGVISVAQPANDVAVKIRSLLTKEEVIIGPLKPDEEEKDALEPTDKQAKEDKDEDKDTNTTKTEKKEKIRSKEINAPQSQQDLKFSHWGRHGEKFEVTPLSSELLFYPETSTVTITDDCPGGLVQFEGRQGVFIEGQITPALSGVAITITAPTQDEIRVLTDDKGQYRVGPLHGDIEYSLMAHKQGFILEAVPRKKGNFQAYELGQINIKVTDQDSEPLSGVLLSLSGGQFRSNNVTFDNGTMVFYNLGPGQYFFRPMLKEYVFSPASQMIDVAEGETVNIHVKGKRVAFSCYGSISSLNGEPEKAVALEAVGLTSCEGMQEETVSDQDGGYRLRGLQPGCTYQIRVKTGEFNPHLERASPAFVDISISDKDVEHVNIIAFRQLNQFEITGHVITDYEFVSTLKVVFFRESNLDSPVVTSSVGIASYFQLPSVPNDGQVYVLRLESTLSKQNYKYDLPEATVTASGIRKHVTFTFAPEHQKFEPEPSQGSMLALPLLVLFIVLAVNHSKVLPFLQQGSQLLQGVPADQLQVPAVEADPIRNKHKIRRR